MITNLTNLTLIKHEITANSKDALFEELAQMLIEDKRISDKSGFLNDIYAREALGVTSSEGIAYPHTKSKTVVNPAIAIGIKRAGIDYEDEDGINPTVFFMIASPDNGSDHHIYVLQELFSKFDDEFVRKLTNTKNEKQVLNVLINS